MATTIENLSTLTPEEFSNYFMNALKEELSVYNLQASKVGFIGFLVNLLGNLAYDSKIYKDSLFKEAFVATAQNDDNIFLHSAIYGYIPELAKPSIANGTIEFDFSLLASPSAYNKRRSVVFGFADSITNEYNTEFAVDNETIFTSGTVYSFNYEDGQYQVVISRQDGTVITMPSNTPIISADLVDFKQEQNESVSFKLPNYPFNTYYTYNFSVEESYVSKIDVYVKNADDVEFKKFDIANVKYLKNGNDSCVFFNKINDTDYSLEFGSGKHGEWIPGAEVKLVIHKTKGAAGNFAQEKQCKINAPIQAMVFDEDINGNISDPFTIDTSVYFKVKFNYAEDGVDPLTGEELRQEVVNYIQTRDNFISEDDFYNVIEKYTTDFRLLNKKTQLQENIIYALRALRDEFQVPIKSTNIVPGVFNSKQKFTNLTYSTLTSGSLVPGEYKYKVFAYDTLGNSIQSEEITVNVLKTTSKSIKLTWDDMNGVVHYRVYLRDNNYLYYYDTTNSYFIDNGKNDKLTERGDNQIKDASKKRVVFPEFNYEGTDYISPFMYEYDEYMNMYIGYLFYPELMINFNSIVQTNNSMSTITSIHPSIFLSIKYDPEGYLTYIYLKSYQELQGWTFKLTVPEIGIESQTMESVDENTAKYIYVENDGILPENTIISVQCYYNYQHVFTAKTPAITQCYSFSDQLQFPLYSLNNNSYLVDVPILDKNKFNENREYWLDKIYDFCIGFNFEENRMISDNIGLRFLNTLGVYSYIALNTFKQKGTLFKDTRYIKINPRGISPYPDVVPNNGDGWIIKEDFTLPIASTVVVKEDDNLYSTINYGGNADTGNNVILIPYQIIVNGDYSSYAKSLDVLVIKQSNLGLDGKYRIVRVDYDKEKNKTSFTTFDRLPVTTNDGVLYFVGYEAWRRGGVDNIATWNNATKCWIFTEINPGDIVTTKNNSISETWIYKNNYEYVKYSVLYPLKFSTKITIDKNKVVQYGIDLDLTRDQLKLELARYFQLFLSGTDVVYYPSTIIDFIIEPRRSWIKHVQIKVTDNSGNELSDGLETLSEAEIKKNLSGSKLDMLNYTSTFISWDTDNIEITFTSD